MVWLVQRIRKYRPKVDSFVLFADELVKMEEVINQKFEYRLRDITSALRAAFLDYQIKFPSQLHFGPTVDDGGLKVALLALSSLNVVQIGISSSWRIICQIDIPSNLNSDEAVQKIWLPSFQNDRNCSDVEIYRLRLIAETINSVPRLI